MWKKLELWGDGIAEAIDIELRQLHDREVGEPKMKHDLPPEARRLALHYLMFLKKKRTWKIKGRGYADGRKKSRVRRPHTWNQSLLPQS